LSEELREIAERIGAEAYLSECIVEEETADKYYIDDAGNCIILNASCDGDCRRCLVPIRRSIDFLTKQMSDQIVTVKR